MRRLIAAALVSSAVALTAPAVAPATEPTSIAASASAACTQAKIEGERKCIARGQYCRRSTRAMRDYRRYGLSCTKRDRNGRYHLE